MRTAPDGQKKAWRVFGIHGLRDPDTEDACTKLQTLDGPHFG